MKKFLIICLAFIIGYFSICVLNISNFNKQISTHTNGYYTKNDIDCVLNNNLDVFNQTIELFENKYDDIALNTSFKPPIIMLSERDYEEYTSKYFNGEELQQINKYLNEILVRLKFTDFIIAENHIYRIQQRGMDDNTEIGVIFDETRNNKSELADNWLFHYKRDRSNPSTNYIGRWLFDLLYN